MPLVSPAFYYSRLRLGLTLVSNMLAADFYGRVRMNGPTLSHDSKTYHRSPEISSTAFYAFAPRFLQTPPHGGALALRYHFSSIRM